MAEIVLDGISKSYGDHKVLQNLSLKLEDGECFTLIGPSGCGKTVLLRIIAGFESLDAGSMRIGSEVVADAGTGVFLPAEQRSLGVVFQDYAVWPHMTVRQNVGYPLKIAKADPAEAAKLVQKSINDVNLTGMEDRLPSQLSGGQQQRVALARALVAQPSLLLLDEPLNNLDANLREEMRFEIKALQKNLGVTILYVTHDQEIALAISDRMAVMDEQGALRQVGAPAELFARPVDEFVFSFLGMSNFLHVTARDGAADLAGQAFPLLPEAGLDGELRVGFRPSDVVLRRTGEGVRATVRRASFLGAFMDYQLEVGGQCLRTAVDTHEALANDRLFKEGEDCVFTLRNAHWFK
ncbi:ABC transporter ATP-binding protein [Desulfovibrio legallii]|jgi:iron(III) transport system ATP-binding protein|uniref:Iron(III) transport system ATP-binding protein n=1 Tax=Desulfovibrio legallii TaxID=571438 RepID=A0A1G7I2S3_9BACT|nr:ABC transporter ATP-binding protein [Desulfovibrio legallii]SDF06975.1 iron(III) transport system ATP-binding protein [Desulfovibrio legallii]